MPDAEVNATLTARHDLDDRTTIFRVRPDFGILRFVAGQWTELGLPKAEEGDIGPSGGEFEKDGVVRRAYSICSKPGGEELEFFFNRVDEGQLTRWLWQVQPGGRLYVDPEARGHFTLDGIPEETDLVFVATGTGIAPFVSLLRTFAGTDRWRRLVLVHGARSRSQLGFYEELMALAMHDPTIVYLPILSREPGESTWGGLRGRTPELFVNSGTFAAETDLPLDPATSHVYLCGNAGMISAVEDRLMPLGYTPRWMDPEGNIHTEIYY